MNFIRKIGNSDIQLPITRVHKKAAENRSAASWVIKNIGIQIRHELKTWPFT